MLSKFMNRCFEMDEPWGFITCFGTFSFTILLLIVLVSVIPFFGAFLIILVALSAPTLYVIALVKFFRKGKKDVG